MNDRVVDTAYGKVVVREFQTMFDNPLAGVEKGSSQFVVFDGEDNEMLAWGYTPASAVDAAIDQMIKKLGYRL